MALTSEILKADTSLAGLTDAQLATIVTLSTNDEATIIGDRIGKLHGQYDTDVLTVSGIAKNQGEKSYDYVKRVIGDFKTKVSNLDTQITTLAAEKNALNAKILAGSTDAEVKQALLDATNKLTSLQALYDTDKAKFDNEVSGYKKQVTQVHIDYAYDAANNSLKFKAGIPDSVKGILIKDAKAKIEATYVPELQDVNGVKTLIFRDKEGKIASNPANKLNPFTVTELLSDALKEVIDVNVQQTGTGTKNIATTKSASTVLDLSSYTTQVQADDAIRAHLLSQGFVLTDPAFAEKQAAIRTEAGVDKLPTR